MAAIDCCRLPTKLGDQRLGFSRLASLASFNLAVCSLRSQTELVWSRYAWVEIGPAIIHMPPSMLDRPSCIRCLARKLRPSGPQFPPLFGVTQLVGLPSSVALVDRWPAQLCSPHSSVARPAWQPLQPSRLSSPAGCRAWLAAQPSWFPIWVGCLQWSMTAIMNCDGLQLQIASLQHVILCNL